MKKPNISNLIPVIRNKYNKLVLIVGLPYSGKTKTLKEFEGWNTRYINIGLEISEQLLDYAIEGRREAIDTIFNDYIVNYRDKVLLFDNIELLFDPDLGVEVLDLFIKLSRHIVCVVAWTGRVSDGVLRYGEPGYWGYKSYNVKGIEVIDLNGESGEV